MYNAANIIADAATGCLTQVAEATNSFYSDELGLTVRQSFYIYPDDTIVFLNAADGGYKGGLVTGEDAETFRAIYSRYF